MQRLNNEQITALDSSYRRIVSAINKNSQIEISKPEYNKDYYYYIPFYNIENLIRLIYKTNKSLKTKSFIDIGCGYNIISAFMINIGFERAQGLEYNTVFKDQDYTYMGDLLNFNFNKFDILYAYNPIKNNKIMLTGLKNIINTMKPKAKFYYVNANIKHVDLISMGFILIGSIYLYTKK